MVTKNLEVKLVIQKCCKCQQPIFQYNIIKGKVADLTLKKSYETTTIGNICSQCLAQKEIKEKIKKDTVELLEYCKKCEKRGKNCNLDKCKKFKKFIEKTEKGVNING